ncbi:MAG: helix-turn-helix transcriptional regulator [Pseudomonadota bacterium]
MIQLLLAAGFVQSLLLLAIYGFRLRQPAGSRSLVLLLLGAVAGSLYQGYVTHPSTGLADFKLSTLSFYFYWCQGPLLYLWLRSAFGQAQVLPMASIHFVLPAIWFANTAVATVAPPGLIDTGQIWVFYVLYAQMLFYMALCLSAIDRARVVFQATRSNPAFFIHGRVRLLIVGVAVFWVLDCLTTSANLLGAGLGLTPYDFYTVGESLLTCVLVLHLSSGRGSGIQHPVDSRNDAEAKYATSQLDRESSEAIADLVTRLMQEQRVYRDPDLSLPKLAEMASTSTHALSQVLNQDLNQNFFEFVNRYRIEAACAELTGNANPPRKILDLALDVGFSSKNTFNRAFKRYQGCTPMEYRARARQKV